ncbi:MAG: kynureninase [Sphingomonas sp.]
MISLETARKLDAEDPLRGFRDQFALPEGVIYLDGNSLGPLPIATREAMKDLVDRQWGERLIRGWNDGWIDAPQRVGDKIARLIGADTGEVIACDSTSVNLFKLIVAALNRDPGRRTIVSELGSFPTDLHVAEGAVNCVAGARLRAVPRDQLDDAIDADTALLLLSHVHYKTSERFDMVEWTKRAQRAGALVLWDLSHSAGAVPVNLNAASADLAVGCGYKFLNGGPGAPAYMFVAKRWQAALYNPVSGWMGHARPFDFIDHYEAAHGIKRWLTGTPSIVAMTALETGVDLMLKANMRVVWGKSHAMYHYLASFGRQAGLECITTVDLEMRGSHIAFRHPHAYPLCQALIAEGVIGDFRDPDILRFGITPLYLGFEDILRAGTILCDIVSSKRYLDPAFSKRHAVT